MSKSFQRLVAITLVSVLTMVYYITPANAALMSAAKVTLSEPRAALASNYAFNATTGAATTGAIKGIKMAWRTDASTNNTMPGGLNLGDATLNATITGLAGAWTIDKTDAASGILYIVNATGAGVAATTALGWQIDSITNPPIVTSGTNGCLYNGTNSSSGTCFIRVKTFDTEAIATMQAETSTNILDQVTVAFTVNAGVQVTAKVDPSLTFTVTGVASGSAANGQTTSATTEFNTLPFGYLATNTPKWLAHDLTVKTNAVAGYTVTMKMATAMTGTYGANNIDPFVHDVASPGVWGTPEAWATPDGNVANTDTGWLGANTTDVDVSGWGTPTGLWGPVQSSQANQIMRSTTPDLGNVATRITYAIEANVYQPSDAYTGTLVYNCVPTY